PERLHDPVGRVAGTQPQREQRGPDVQPNAGHRARLRHVRLPRRGGRVRRAPPASGPVRASGIGRPGGPRNAAGPGRLVRASEVVIAVASRSGFGCKSGSCRLVTLIGPRTDCGPENPGGERVRWRGVSQFLPGGAASAARNSAARSRGNMESNTSRGGTDWPFSPRLANSLSSASSLFQSRYAATDSVTVV